MTTIRPGRAPGALLAAAVLAFAPAQLTAQQSGATADSSGTSAPTVVPAPACTTAVMLAVPPLGEPTGSLARLAELAGAARLRGRLINDPWSDLSLELCNGVPEPLRALVRPALPRRGPAVFALLPLTTYDDYNSAYPRDRDNGAMWAGRGISSAIYGGITARWGPVSAAVFPGAIYQQNQAFQIDSAHVPGFSPFILPGYGTAIDLPQRFGDNGYWTLDPGESYLRVDAFGLQAGVSTENLRYGPAVRNPLMLTYTGPGFPHVFAGTGRPLNIGIGHIEGKVLWGRLSQSPYFSGNVANQHAMLAATVGEFQPRWVPELFLGGTLIYEAYPPPGGFGLGGYLGALLNHPTSSSAGNSPGNGLGALYLRWALPGSGFDAYAEWARDDYSWTAESFLMEPDHSQTYTLGFQKVVTTRTHWVRLLGELTHLEAANPLRGGRGVVEMYTHGVVIQGHTNEGQPLGAATGPGSDAQFVGADVFTGWGSSGGYIERVRYNDDAYYGNWARFYGNSAHDVELTGGLRQSLYWRGVVLRSELTYSYRIDRSFLGLDGVNWNLRKDRNIGLRLGASWSPPLFGPRALAERP